MDVLKDPILSSVCARVFWLCACVSRMCPPFVTILRPSPSRWGTNWQPRTYLDVLWNAFKPSPLALPTNRSRVVCVTCPTHCGWSVRTPLAGCGAHAGCSKTAPGSPRATLVALYPLANASYQDGCMTVRRWAKVLAGVSRFPGWHVVRGGQTLHICNWRCWFSREFACCPALCCDCLSHLLGVGQFLAKMKSPQCCLWVQFHEQGTRDHVTINVPPCL